MAGPGVVRRECSRLLLRTRPRSGVVAEPRARCVCHRLVRAVRPREDVAATGGALPCTARRELPPGVCAFGTARGVQGLIASATSIRLRLDSGECARRAAAYRRRVALGIPA